MKQMFSILLSLFITSPAWGAVTFDNSTTASDIDGGSTTTFSHATGAGCNNGVIFVAVFLNAASLPTITGITYNSVALGAVTPTATATNIPGDRNVSLWYLKAPATGSNDVAITLSGNADETAAIAATFCGVNQGTAIGSSVTANGNDTTPTVDATSAAGELVIDAVFVRGDTGQTLTAGGGQSDRANFCYNSDCTEWVMAMSSEAGAATTTMSWTAISANWATIAVPIKPAASAARPLGAIVFQ